MLLHVQTAIFCRHTWPFSSQGLRFRNPFLLHVHHMFRLERGRARNSAEAYPGLWLNPTFATFYSLPQKSATSLECTISDMFFVLATECVIVCPFSRSVGSTGCSGGPGAGWPAQCLEHPGVPHAKRMAGVWTLRLRYLVDSSRYGPVCFRRHVGFR